MRHMNELVERVAGYQMLMHKWFVMGLLLLHTWHAAAINMLEHITITSPKKVLKGDLVGSSDMYYCEVYLPYDVGKKHHPIYAGNPIDATDYANRFVEAHL